jgi:hypothetical protein
LIESDGTFYLIDQENMQNALSRLERPEESVAGILNDSDIFLRWPLRTGEKFCDTEGMARPDSMYCWFVASFNPAQKMKISGVRPGLGDANKLIYRTNPDQDQFTFIPGIGISAYEYHHHGTVADTELTLVEFHQPQQ